MNGFVPIERFDHSSFMLHEKSDFFFVYGGCNLRMSHLDYVYMYCFSSHEWIRLCNRNYTCGGPFQSRGSLLFADHEQVPQSRMGVSCVVTRDCRIVIFGGELRGLLNDMFTCALPRYCGLQSQNNVRMEAMRQFLSGLHGKQRINNFSDCLVRFSKT